MSLTSLNLTSTNTSKEIRQTQVEIDFQPERSQKPSNPYFYVSVDLDKSFAPLESSSSSLVVTPRPGKSGHNLFFESLPAILDAISSSLLNKKRTVIRIFNGTVISESTDLGIALAMIVLCMSMHSDSLVSFFN